MLPLEQIARLLSGRLKGEGNTPIVRLSAIAEAAEGDITFLADRRSKPLLATTRASAVMVAEDAAADAPDRLNLVIVKDPFAAYMKVAELFADHTKRPPGVSPLAAVSATAQVADTAVISPYAVIGDRTVIGAGAVIHPFVYIGDDVTVGSGTVLHPHVTVYDRVVIGSGVTVHSGTVLGADGFAYRWDGEKHAKIPQIGTVVIEDDVEIGANSTVDRASLGKTVIGRGTKIDNLVMIAHNVTIGEHSVIVAQVGIAGSAKIGRNVVLAGQAGVRDHASVGDFVQAGGQAGITGDVPANSLVNGTPHMPHRDWLRLQGHLKRLHTLFERLKRVEQRLEADDHHD